jgi:anti-sigma-K factor RskA
MEHPDSDRLARVALDGGPADADVTQHVDGCPTCREEVDDLRDLADLARAVRSERLEPPPPHVWQGVVDELGLEGRRTSSTRGTRPLLWAAAAAVVGLGIGSLATWAVVRGDDDPAVAAEVVRTAELAPLPEGGATTAGTARLLETTDGAQLVEVSAPELGSADGHFEVWLIRPDSTQMVSLGVLPSGDVAEFAVPASLLADGYTLVDVSDEPDDGEPTHSGDSVLRGDLAG